jgi:hypothetical protein
MANGFARAAGSGCTRIGNGDMPISMQEYRRRTERDWLETPVRLLRAVKTVGGVEFPAGTLGTICRKFKGFEIRSAPCPHCGVRVGIKELKPADLEIVE